jgi:hypothetical protein
VAVACALLFGATWTAAAWGAGAGLGTAALYGGGLTLNAYLAVMTILDAKRHKVRLVSGIALALAPVIGVLAIALAIDPL